MKLNKRQFIKSSAAAMGVASLSGNLLATPAPTIATANTDTLQDITLNTPAITVTERNQRISKAQKLMQKLNISALILEPGAAMNYFSGIQWRRSERVTALIIPREGQVAIVCPHFEEPSIRESLAIAGDVRVWNEHESPFLRVQQILSKKGLDKGKLAFEQSVRYFVLRGVMSTLPTMTDIIADPITQACRMYKSARELALMHKANEITLKAYSYVWARLAASMTSTDVSQLMRNAQTKLGGKNAWSMALFDDASAFPHGTHKIHTIKNGSLILMDCGCSVHGYQSDISRTFIFGEASKRQREVWQTVSKGQHIVFEKAQLGVHAGSVDDAVRHYYESLGYGPGYKTPGLSHRTGHGIGLEVHESINFVHGEQGVLEAGMCFSNEPGLYIVGEFGVRLEDCIYMSAKGPRWFTKPARSIEEPVGLMGDSIVL